MRIPRVAAILLLAVPLFGATRRVAIDGANLNDCVAEPCRTIGHAIARANPGDIIEVGPGKFFFGEFVTKAVTLRGSQAGVDARGRTNVPETILSGTSILDVDGMVIDGVTFDCMQDCDQPLSVERGVRVVNSVFRGGAFQLNVYLVVDGTVEVLNNDFIGQRINNGSPIEVVSKTTALGIGGFFGGAQAHANVRVESNRFSGSSSAAISLRDLAPLDDAITIRNNEFVLPETGGRGFDLNNVDGVRIEGNTITGGFDPAIRIGNSRGVQVIGNSIRDNAAAGIEARDGSEVEVHVNRFAGNPVDIRAFGTAIVNAENNWLNGMRSVGPPAVLNALPRLDMRVTASPERIAPQRTSVVVVDLNHNSDGELVPGFPDGAIVEFTAEGGTVSPERATVIGGVATTTFTSNAIGEGVVYATLDGAYRPAQILTVQSRRRAVGN